MHACMQKKPQWMCQYRRMSKSSWTDTSSRRGEAPNNFTSAGMDSPYYLILSLDWCTITDVHLKTPVDWPNLKEDKVKCHALFCEGGGAQSQL